MGSPQSTRCALRPGKRGKLRQPRTHANLPRRKMPLGARLTLRIPRALPASSPALACPAACSLSAPPASSLALSPRGSAPPPAPLHGSQRQPSVPQLQGCRCCLAGDRRLAASSGEDSLPGKPFLYPPNPPVSAFLQGWSISPGRAWHWKMPKCPGRRELPVPSAQHGRAPGASVQPGTQPAAWQGDNHAGCCRRSQAVGSQPPSVFGFFQQHQSTPLHPPGLQIGSTLLQMASQLKPSFFPPQQENLDHAVPKPETGSRSKQHPGGAAEG